MGDKNDFVAIYKIINYYVCDVDWLSLLQDILLCDLDFWRGQVILVTEPPRIFIGVFDNRFWITEWIDTANVSSRLLGQFPEQNC